MKENLQSIIRGVCEANPDPKARWKAMRSIKWRMRGPCGQFVGLDAANGYRCAFVPESEAMVFDGRDNEEHKLEFYGVCLKSKLSVEIVSCAS